MMTTTTTDASVWRCPSCRMRLLSTRPSPSCPDCAKIGRYIPMVPYHPPTSNPAEVTSPAPVRLGDVAYTEPARLPLVGLEGVAAALGGGVVPGQVLMLAGAPGLGKSRLLLMITESFRSPVYVSAEMALSQLRGYGEALGCARHAFVFGHGDVAAVVRAGDALGADAVMIDSLQAVWVDGIEGAVGSVRQVRAVARLARALAGRPSAPVVWLAVQVTKEGDAAGPEEIKHLVDTECYLEAGPSPELRVFRVEKNRCGPSGGAAVLVMGEGGRLTEPRA